MTIVPTLRRLRQESCNKTQAVLSSVESSVRPCLRRKEKNCTIPWHAWCSSKARSSRGCYELPGLTGTRKQATHPTSSWQSWLFTSKYHTSHLYQPQLWSCQLPSMGLLRHTDSLPDGRVRPHEFTNRLTAAFVTRSRTSPSTPLSDVF